MSENPTEPKIATTDNIDFVIGSIAGLEERDGAGWCLRLHTGITIVFGRLKPECTIGDELVVTFRKPAR